MLSDPDVSDSPESRDFTAVITCNYTNPPATTIRDSRLSPLHTKRATQRSFHLPIPLTISTLPPCPLPSSLPNIFRARRQRELGKAFDGFAGRRIPRPRTLYGFIRGGLGGRGLGGRGLIFRGAFGIAPLYALTSLPWKRV